MEKDKRHVEARQLTSYEIDRYANIALNNSKLKAIGLKPLVNKELQKKSVRVGIDKIDLQPTLSETSGIINVSHGNSRKEKQPHLQSQERPQRNNRAQGSLPPIMIDEQRSKQSQLQNSTGRQEIQQEKASKKQQQTSESTTQEQAKKNYCPPGSNSKFLRMKQMTALRGQKCIVDKQFGILEEELSSSAEGLRTHSDIVRDLHEGDFQEDASNDQILAEKENSDTRKKKCRGRTILADVHNWEKQEYIILDDMGQPSGPTKQIVDTFTRFLGTIAKDATLCPLNYISWKRVPNKDNIWEYVKKRFDISELGKKYVLSAINADWRTYKSRIKKDHYSKYKTIEERLANRPEHLPENQFRGLLKYWDSAEAEELSKINKENRQKQCDLHTMGPTSYSMLRAKLKEDDPDKKEPSQADVYVESRKRKVGRNYLTSNEETLQNIDKLKKLKALDDESANSDPYYDVITKKEHYGRVRLYGRGVTKSTLKNKDPNTPYILPPIFLETITKKLEKDMDDMLQNKIADVISKIREANPGADLNIPSFQGNEGNISGENDDEVSESSDPTNLEERCC